MSLVWNRGANIIAGFGHRMMTTVPNGGGRLGVYIITLFGTWSDICNIVKPIISKRACLSNHMFIFFTGMSCYQLLEGGRPAFGLGTIVSLDGMGRHIGRDVLTFTYNPAAGTCRDPFSNI